MKQTQHHENNGEAVVWLTAEQVAKHIGVTSRTIWTMVEDGRLIGHRLGHRIIRFRRDQIDSAFEAFGPAAVS